MAKRRTPPRYKSGPKKGQFMPKRARARKAAPKRKRARRNPGRTVAKRAAPRRRAATKRRSAPRKRTYRRNPKLNIIGTLTDGVVEAGQILVGKAAVRSIPDLAKLPKEGNVGIAVQIGTALVIGYASEMFLSRDASRAMTAGALTAPLETLIVSYKVPWLSAALSPVSAANGLQAYVQGAPELGRYVKRPRVASATGSTERGLGRYATERGMNYGYGG